MTKMSKKVRYECPSCGRMFSSREELNEHVEEEHWEQSDEEEW
jgi:uncharacterized C2H2 Zn-finger protein